GHEFPPDLLREPGLARAARPDHVDEPVGLDELGDVALLDLATDEVRRWGGEVMRRCHGRTRTWELALQPRTGQLEQALPAVEAAQLEESKINKGVAFGQIGGEASGR